MNFSRALALAGVLTMAPFAAVAQAQPPTAQASAAPAEGSLWRSLPHMVLEQTFSGPLQDTILQRWRDPATGVVCFIYLPMTARHSAPEPNGLVEYGANGIGSLSCVTPPSQAVR